MKCCDPHLNRNSPLQRSILYLRYFILYTMMEAQTFVLWGWIFHFRALFSWTIHVSWYRQCIYKQISCILFYFPFSIMLSSRHKSMRTYYFWYSEISSMLYHWLYFVPNMIVISVIDKPCISCWSVSPIKLWIIDTN